MLARTEEELVLFTKMDEEMYEREGKQARVAEIMAKRPGLKDYSRVNWRLTQDWEVPEWVKVQPVNKEEEEKKIVELGKRQRNKFVNYDNMSELRYMQIIQDGGDPHEVLRQEVLKRESRRNRGLPSQEEQPDADEDDDEMDSQDSRDQDDDYRGPRATKRRKREDGSAANLSSSNHASRSRKKERQADPTMEVDSAPRIPSDKPEDIMAKAAAAEASQNNNDDIIRDDTDEKK